MHNNTSRSVCDNERCERKTPLSDVERTRRSRVGKRAKLWDEIEVKLFEDAVKTLYGWGDWVSVACVIPTRTKSK
ncbi:MAG: SANT/Myb-like DNA-binding domain-containing protein [Nitrosomonadaceae bacterium]